MCGIIFAKRFDLKKARKLVEKRYDKQKTRGQQGFGFIEIINGVVGNEFRAEEEKDINSFLTSSDCDEMLFHHRFPTSTPNFIEATHPIKVSHSSLKYDYYVVHNGIISNDSKLKIKHNKQGFKYVTEICKRYITSGNTYEELMWNDSEAFAIDIAQVIETNKEVEAKGSIAFIALQFDKKTQKAVSLYFGRNYRNPLKIELDDNIFCLSSESGEEIKANKLNKFDYETEQFSAIEKEIGEKWSSNNYQYKNESTSQDFGFKCDGTDKIDKKYFNWNEIKDDEDDGDIAQYAKDSYYTRLQVVYDEIEQLKEDIEFYTARKDTEEVAELQGDLSDLQAELDKLYNTSEDEYYG